MFGQHEGASVNTITFSQVASSPVPRERFLSAMAVEANELQIILARARAFLAKPLIFFSIHLIYVASSHYKSITPAMEFLVVVGEWLTVAYAFFAFWFRDRIQNGDFFKTTFHAALIGFLADVTLCLALAVPHLSLASAAGVQAPFAVVSVILVVPLSLYSFSFDVGPYRIVGFLVCTVALAFLHVVIPSHYPQDLKFVELQQFIFVTITYFFIYLCAEICVRRTADLIGRAVKQEVHRDRLAKALAPRAVERLEREEILRMDGEEGLAAVLFVDIRGFVSIAEELPPKDVLAILNDCLSRMAGAVLESRGTIDKFTGDGLLAVFPHSTENRVPARSAIECALAIRRRISELNSARRGRGEACLRIGIGIHYGPVITGWIGSPERPEYTVLGDTVNLASRIEALTKRLGVDILLSAETYHSVSELASCESMGPQWIRGCKRPVEVFAVI